MKVIYSIEDGYSGAPRPQTLDIPDIDEIINDFEDVMDVIHGDIYKDILQKISFKIINRDEITNYIAEKMKIRNNL